MYSLRECCWQHLGQYKNIFYLLVYLLVNFSDSKVEPLDPPQSCNPGDRVFVAGYERMTCGREYLAVC